MCTGTCIISLKPYIWLELELCPSGSTLWAPGTKQDTPDPQGPLDANDNKVICLPNRLEVLCHTDAEGDAVHWHADHPGDLGARVWVHPISAIFRHVSKTNRWGKWIIGESRGQTETTLEPHPPLPPQPWAKQRRGWPLKEQFVTCQPSVVK